VAGNAQVEVEHAEEHQVAKHDHEGDQVAFAGGGQIRDYKWVPEANDVTNSPWMHQEHGAGAQGQGNEAVQTVEPRNDHNHNQCPVRWTPAYAGPRPRSSSHSSRLRCRPAGRSRRSRRRNSSCCGHYAFASNPPLCYAIDLYYVILLL